MIKFKLKVELAKADMTQKALAERTGIRPSTISDISKGTVKNRGDCRRASAATTHPIPLGGGPFPWNDPQGDPGGLDTPTRNSRIGGSGPTRLAS